MSVAAAGTAGTPAGRTTVRSEALRRIVVAVAAQLAGVAAHAVRANLADSRGALTVSVASRLDVGTRAAGTIVERATVIAEAVTARLDGLAGRSTGRIDVRFSGLQRPQGRRLR